MTSNSRSVSAIRRTPYLFIAPFVVIYCLFSLAPILYTAVISFSEWNGFDSSNIHFIGFQNYLNLLSDSRFGSALANTLIFLALILPVQIALGMLLAVLLYDKTTRLRNGFRLLNFLPYLTTPIAVGIIFRITFDPTYGFVNRFLSLIGIPPVLWLSTAWPARILVAFTCVWQNFGYTAVLFLAGMTNISAEVLEASIVDGAGKRQQFWLVTLPLLRQIVLFVVLTSMIGCFQMFDTPYLLFPKLMGGPDGSAMTAMLLMYDTAFGSVMKFGYGAAISYALVIVIAVVSILFNKLMEERG